MKIDYTQLFFDEEAVTIRVNEEDKTYNNQQWTIQLRSIGVSLKPDCKIGSWTENFWVRSPKGMKGEEYKSRESMKKSVEKILKNNGYHFLRWQPKED